MDDPAEMTRRDWMGLMARAPAAELARLLAAAVPEEPAHRWLRSPETGAVMVRGRAGATGAPFNLGEMAVTRCALELIDGAAGHAWVQGRDKAHARRAALVDALMQGPEAARLRAAILAPLADAEAARRGGTARRAAATRVDFFTLARGEP
jgi:alpha-D-ribose 1-methylphosphonate 5-triphosphate synthase subunit PhnG